MINYELAKQLKDAGFPFPVFTIGREIYVNEILTFISDDLLNNYFTSIVSKSVPIPTLSELIEACEDKLIDLRHNPESGKWGAADHANWGRIETTISYGHTPEEAVSRLYLALHEANS